MHRSSSNRQRVRQKSIQTSIWILLAHYPPDRHHQRIGCTDRLVDRCLAGYQWPRPSAVPDHVADTLSEHWLAGRASQPAGSHRGMISGIARTKCVHVWNCVGSLTLTRQIVKV
jgi:hypothetical protein